VQPVSVAEVADELYALTPAEFTAARDERARQVRAAGQRDEAAAIKKLARPTASAWLVNQLVRAAPDRMTRLYELGEALQEAQRNLAGDRLRELSVQRRQVINELLPAASDLASHADQTASAAVLGEVRATLEAALADADARAAVRSGRLTKALAYAGLGEVDLTAALAVVAEPRAGKGARLAAPAGSTSAPRAGSDGAAPAESGPAGVRAPGRSGRSTADGAERGAGAVRAAQAAADQAAAALDVAERAVTGVDEQRQFLRRRISHLERELSEAHGADAQLAREGKQAERGRAAAARTLAAAKRRLDQARRLAGDTD
jgi:hypothetical protein